MLTFSKDLPDAQNSALPPEAAPVAIDQVGIRAFRVPLLWDAGQRLETHLEASVSVPAGVRGANLSRFTCLLQDYQDSIVHPQMLEKLLQDYQQAMGGQAVWVRFSAQYPLITESLLSHLMGYQYYPVAFEATRDAQGRFSWLFCLDYAYSSTCPASAALAEQVRQQSGICATAHAQRSLAALRLHFRPGAYLSPAALVQACRRAIPTELQVMVKRQDEQAFAALNGQNLLFVEDAARRLYAVLDALPELAAYSIHCEHFESLHSHSAFARLSKG